MTEAEQEPEVDLLVDGPMTWSISTPPGRANRRSVMVSCRHGSMTPPEMTATQIVTPTDAMLVTNAALNLQRRFGCHCYPSPAP